MRWWVLALLLTAHPAAQEAADPEAGVSEAFDFLLRRGLVEPSQGLMLCAFGFAPEAAVLGRRVLEDMLPSNYRAHVAFFHLPDETPQEVVDLLRDFPENVHVPSETEAFQSLCSVDLLAVEDPRFHGEVLHATAQGPSVVLGYFSSPCVGEAKYACHAFTSMWEALAGGKTSCGQHFCAAVVAAEDLQDPLFAGLDCAGVQGQSASLSVTSQWQQDWFVYHNFVRGTETDAREGQPASRQGVFVDVGAFHPIHLSNTFFFERCLGWRGVCVEPNPNWGPYFRAYRPNCKLVQNCVWSQPRNVTMSFEKDPIEAYIQEEEGPSGAEGLCSSGAVLIKGGGSRPAFTAECRTLEDILSRAGLRRPATIDYLSMDAEAAEAEIFRDFPFADFDISVISVEIQVKNYYELDVILTMAGYAKVAVLGGDHVYGKLSKGFSMPAGAAAWHRILAKDFHAHGAPQTATLAGKAS